MTVTAGRKKTIYRRALLALIILALSLIQNGAGRFLKIGGAGPLLLIPAVTAAAMFEGDVAGIFYGLFAGALWDAFAKGNNFNSIYLVAVGYICGTLIITLMRNNFMTHLILSGAASLLYCTGYWLYHFIICGVDRALLTLIGFYLPMALYTTVLSPVIFLIVRFVHSKFMPRQYSED